MYQSRRRSVFCTSSLFRPEQELAEEHTHFSFIKIPLLPRKSVYRKLSIERNQLSFLASFFLLQLNSDGRFRSIVMSTSHKIASLLHCLPALRDDEKRRPGEVSLLNRWLSDSFLRRVLKSQPYEVELSEDRHFNQVMARGHDFMERFDGSNSTGIFRKKYMKSYFYYITSEENMQATRRI